MNSNKYSQLGKASMEKKTFSFGQCPNHLTPPPDPNSGNLVLFFGRQKRRFARMTEIFFDDDNDGLNDNYDDNFGNAISFRSVQGEGKGVISNKCHIYF